MRKERGEPSAPELDGTGLANPWDPARPHSRDSKRSRTVNLVIGNRQDRNTPFDLQTRFAQALRELGHRVKQLERPAVAPEYHDLQGNQEVNAIALCPHHGTALNE
jgi:hypothetical protein